MVKQKDEAAQARSDKWKASEKARFDGYTQASNPPPPPKLQPRRSVKVHTVYFFTAPKI
jgi:hypothetical protein